MAQSNSFGQRSADRDAARRAAALAAAAQQSGLKKSSVFFFAIAGLCTLTAVGAATLIFRNALVGDTMEGGAEPASQVRGIHPRTKYASEQDFLESRSYAAAVAAIRALPYAEYCRDKPSLTVIKDVLSVVTAGQTGRFMERDDVRLALVAAGPLPPPSSAEDCKARLPALIGDLRSRL
jgi:hypothetical protein